MAVERVIDTRQGDSAHGITYVMNNYIYPPDDPTGKNIRGEAAIEVQRKIHLNGRGSLTLAIGQTRYGDELISQIWTPDPNLVVVRDERASDKYFRVQGFYPVNLDTLRILRSLVADVEALLAGGLPRGMTAR